MSRRMCFRTCVARPPSSRPRGAAMGRIGEPKREIHIPVTHPATPPPPPPAPPGGGAGARPSAHARSRPAAGAGAGGHRSLTAAMELPWDVFATPIPARKLARLGIEHGEVVLRPAFYRQLGASYGVVARAACPL